ncbi:MAG: aldo/keto reductase [Verrucomicrobia bacterium]|nr:aldo/keto reductase [Verrucomicrobiota bacterium]
MADKLRWGLLATGAIAKAFARGVMQSQTGMLAAVGSRSAEKADAFAADFEIPRTHGSYEALLADDGVDAVYISTPHPQHAEWTIKAAEAGKHILVEKPIGLNQYEAQAMIEAAVANRVFLMEAYMYRCHPQTAKLIELLHANVIGDVRIIKATFSFQAGFNPTSRLWSNAAAGGGILDVGGYTTSFARLIAGVATGQPFANPIAVRGTSQLHPETGVDVWAGATLKFASGIGASLNTGIGVNQKNEVWVYGSEGHIVIQNPYAASRGEAMDGSITVHRSGADPEVILIKAPVTSFAYEADVCAAAIRAGKLEDDTPAMTWADTLGNIATQDAWRAAVGLVYEAEKPEHMGPVTLAKRPLKKRVDAPMTYGTIAPLDKPVSRLIMGVDNQVTAPNTAILFDDAFERGINTFDTGYIYGKLKSTLFGHWIQSRGVRDDIVVIAKGAHTPNCNPAALTRELHEQLGWLQTDYADLYIMHRDNPEIPVGKFVDELNQHVAEGRIRAFGGSNWSLDRVKKANAYAKRKGLQGFSLVSNNLSLAEMINPVWAGCQHVHDDASRRWFKRTQMTLLPWSSQARGFFVPERAQPDKHDDWSLSNSWYSDDNFKRQARAIELAKKKGVEPINVALAWVLNQPFPTFPLIGPRQISETRSSLAALEVELTPREMKYLNLEV